MPTIAILEDNEAALKMMQHSISLDAASKWILLNTSNTSTTMIEWLRKNTVDILIADLGLPDFTGIEVIKLCKKLHPNTQIIVCTVFEDDEHLFSSLKAGAHAYILKKDINQLFAQSLNQLLEFGSPMSPSIARRVIESLNFSTQDESLEATNNVTDDETSKTTQKILSKKEFFILDLIARGFKNIEISVIQNVSIHTVHTHVRSIYKKLHVSSKNEAVYEARQLNILH